MGIHSIADLLTHSPAEIEAARSSINLRGAVMRQMTKDGQRKGLTLDQYNEVIARQEHEEHPLCGVCHGHGRLRPRLRSVGAVHPSSAHRCTTKIYYDVVATEAPEEQIPWNLQITFEIGHAVHAQLQKALIKYFGEDFADEVPVNLPEAIVYGGAADGVAESPDWRVLLEIKTISKSQFADLRGPKKEDHLLQASIYAKALDAPFISFLYVSKEGPDHPIKEYVVAYDDAVYQTWLKTKIAKVKVALESGRPPIADAGRYECDQCAYREVCTQRLQKKDPLKR